MIIIEDNSLFYYLNLRAVNIFKFLINNNLTPSFLILLKYWQFVLMVVD